jgi:hypothetical protein
MKFDETLINDLNRLICIYIIAALIKGGIDSTDLLSDLLSYMFYYQVVLPRWPFSDNPLATDLLMTGVLTIVSSMLSGKTLSIEKFVRTLLGVVIYFRWVKPNISKGTVIRDVMETVVILTLNNTSWLELFSKMSGVIVYYALKHHQLVVKDTMFDNM